MKKTLFLSIPFLLIVSCNVAKNPTTAIDTSHSIEAIVLNTGSWVDGKTKGTIYADGDYRTSIFYKTTGVPISGTKITSVSWKWDQLPRGTTTAEITYTPPYQAYPIKSMNITNQQTGTTNFFNDQSARGKIGIKFTSLGGDPYPLFSTSVYDSVRVTFTY